MLNGAPIISGAYKACCNTSCGRYRKPDTKSESTDFRRFDIEYLLGRKIVK